MKHTLPARGIAAALGMLILILDSKTAIMGAGEGLSLCLKTVIPSLFPFFVLSGLLTSTLASIKIPFLRPIAGLTGIPEGAESILITGILGGYPVGAGCIGAAYRRNQLTQPDAERMMAFCSNAGPAFLFGIAPNLFPSNWMAWAVWGIHILSAVAVGVLLPGGSTERSPVSASTPISLPQALNRAVQSMASVCGWVVMFRIVLAFLSRWIFWLLPEWLIAAISGILELTNGCIRLTEVGNIGLRFLLFSGMLAFGGLCVGMQTVSVSDGVSLRLYFPGKILQTLISLWLSLCLQPLLPDGIVMTESLVWVCMISAGLLILCFCRKKQEKSSSFPAKLVV